MPIIKIRVLEPRQRMEVLAPLLQVHARIQIHGRLVRDDVRCGDVWPHSELNEDVRRHVQRLRSQWCDASIGARGRERPGCSGRLRLLALIEQARGRETHPPASGASDRPARAAAGTGAAAARP
jgi:hypothetical protein